jgi:hypothetical protein
MYEAYPKNKFHLQILPLQHCGHNGAHAYSICWFLGRDGRDLQIIEQRLCIVLCVYTMFKKIEKPAACEMRFVICFLNARNMKPADIRQLCEVYGEHAMNDSMVKR